MEYILNDKITIKRPIVFLCGPYYQKDNAGDRRNIMRKTFEKYYGKEILPLIIDDFLTDDNLKDNNINIQLMEEIFAAISSKTYIFLDTMSAASELGLFMNHAFVNQVIAYVPKESDIYNKKNVGYFVKDVILKKNGERAKCVEYRPAIKRSVIATDYAVEHYEFIGNAIPDNIEEDIKNDSDLTPGKVYNIELEEGDKLPEDTYKIIYRHDGNRLVINTSIKLLFYITASVTYEYYKKILKKNNKITISDFDLNLICKKVKESYENFSVKHMGINFTELQINTVLKNSLDEIIYHIVTFMYIYHCFSTYHGLRLVPDHKPLVLEQVKNHPYKVFGITKEEHEILKESMNAVNVCFSQFELKRNGKVRKLVRYSDQKAGEEIRKVHEKIEESLCLKYQSHFSSFAYKKGGSIKLCVEKHLENKSFLKYDINKFFNSINSKKLVKCIEDTFEIDIKYHDITEEIITSFFVEGVLPLGLVISPILSDIYLNEMDIEIEKFASEKGYVYTRYADDILISKRTTLQSDEIAEIEKHLSDELKKRKLNLNEKKRQQINLEREGQHIRYLGVSIVSEVEKNHLSVGKAYIYSVAKEYLQYRELLSKAENQDEKTVFYEARRIAGKVGFIRQIEGEKGWKKLCERLNNKEEYMNGDQLQMN